MNKTLIDMSDREFKLKELEYVERGKERAGYVLEKYHQENLRDISILVISFILTLYSIENGLQVCSLIFATVILLSIYGFSLSVKAFKKAIRFHDKNEKFTYLPVFRIIRYNNRIVLFLFSIGILLFVL